MHMAFELLDEHEQGELVRKWLRENALAILIGIGIGLLFLFGYYQWKENLKRTNAEAATQYAAYVAARDADKNDEAKGMAASLRKDFGKTPYAVLSALREAEVAVSKGDSAAARTELDWAARAAGDDAMRALISLRLARLDLADGKADHAIAKLDAIGKDLYVGLAAELRGDALVKLGKGTDARAAYEAALAALDPQSPGHAFVKMKLGDLASAPATPAAPTAPTPATAEKQKS